MANPQLENGHIRIANELFDAMCRAPLSGREFQVLNAILRRTYGWQKKADSISLEQLKQATGITHRPWLMRLLKSLEDQKIIRGEHTSGYATIYSINKNYQDWTCLTGTTCPAQETRPHVGVGDMTRVQVGGDDPCTGRRPLPKDENIKRHEERHVLKTEESKPASACKYPLLTLYHDLTLRSPTATDRRANEELMASPDYDEAIAAAALKLCHKAALNRGNTPGSFSYYVPSIVEALASGQMPGQKKPATRGGAWKL